MTRAQSLPFVIDKLPDAFPVEPSESDWLLALLRADELSFILDGPTPRTEFGPTPAESAPVTKRKSNSKEVANDHV